MRVLLVQPPVEDFYTTAIRLYPLGLLYVAAVLERAGCEVHILDCLSPLRKKRIPVPADFAYLQSFIENPLFFRGYYRFGIGDEDIVGKIVDFAPEAIGISSQFTAYYQSVVEIVRLIKKNFKMPIFIGGNHATVFPLEIKRRIPEIDAVLCGPAEDSFPEYIDKHGMGILPEKPDWVLMEPAHHLLEGSNYRIGKRTCVSMIASRGCPFHCDFCSVHRMFGRGICYRPIDGVLREMRRNYAQKSARIFNFEDDNLSFDKEWFAEFLASVAADPLLQDIELTAMNGLCVNTLDESILPAMVRAGFRQLNLSFVTQSQNLKSDFHRPLDGPDFERIIRAAQKLDLFLTVYVILGLPGQSFEEAKDSIDYLLDLGVLVGPSIFYIPAASPLYDKLALEPDVKKNWNLYRSSAFAVETDRLPRSRLVELFLYVRRKNLENRKKIG